MVNFHVHSHNSMDCEYSMEEMCLSAISAGVTSLCFTDHYDVNFPAAPEYDLEKCLAEFYTVKEKYGNKIDLYIGMELGQPAENEKEARRLLEDNRLDFVLGSVHNLPGVDDFYFLDYREHDIDSLMTRYFQELISLCRNFKVDSIAHIGYPLRYITRKGFSCDLSRYGEEIEQLLKVMADKDISMEINSSDVSRELKSTIPPQDIINKFYTLGGKSVTIGSDAHRLEKTALDLDVAVACAKKAGFTSQSIYKNRTRIQINF